MGRIIPYIMENKTCSKPPTRDCIGIPTSSSCWQSTHMKTAHMVWVKPPWQHHLWVLLKLEGKMLPNKNRLEMTANWLVVYLPLWRILVSWEYEIPNIWKKNTCSKPPTRQKIFTSSRTSNHCVLLVHPSPITWMMTWAKSHEIPQKVTIFDAKSM